MTSISGDQLAELPTADMITLLFKCHKTITVLSVLPDRPFSEIKALLLAALQSRNLTTIPNSDVPLPEDPDNLEFGVLADKKDASKGWVPLTIKEQEIKGPKATKKKTGGDKSVLNESPLGAGLAAGSWVAYRLKAKSNLSEDVDMEGAEGTPDIQLRWDVVLPSFDDEADES
ncbi:hypothetical protein LTR46_000652 [Exophiala xenobiotica]|nr:hypothetical protein LTR46_000652 [Exophiala xenobiotica]